MKRSVALCAFAVLAAAGPLCHGQAWKEFGPEPFDGSGYTNASGATLSGIITDIAIDPKGQFDTTMYVATGGGGIWKTTNGGATWEIKRDAMQGLFFGAVALDPSDASIVYAGMGGPYCCFSNYGLFRSKDSADHWSALNPNGIFNNLAINAIVLPSSKVILVATSGGLFKSVDSGEHFGNDSSFSNGNPIAIHTPQGSVSNGIISDLKLDTANSSIVYAAINGAGVYKSTDEGSTFPASGKLFSAASFPGGVTGSDVDIKFAQSTLPNNQTMYAFLCQGANPQACGMIKSVNGGNHFTTISMNLSVNQGDYDQIVAVDPQNANGLYVGLRQLYYVSDGGAGGITSSNQIDVNGPHTDEHAIAFCPKSHYTSNPTRVYIGSDGGLATTGGNGATPGSPWAYLNQGFSTALLYSVDIGRGDAANNGYSYGGFQDNGTAALTPLQSGTAWQFQCCGDSSSVAVDPTNPKHALTLNDGCLQSTTDGKSWSTCSSSPPSKAVALGLVSYDPNGGVAYATTSPIGGLNQPQLFQIFQSKDNASTFPLMHTFSKLITVIAQAKGNPNLMWLGMSDGSLRITTNALQGTAATWKKITVNGAPSSQQVQGIAIDPTHHSTVLVVYAGFSGCTDSQPGGGSDTCSSSTAEPPKHIFRTTNAGDHWDNDGGKAGGGDNNLPDLPLYAVTILGTTSPHTYIVGSDVGVMQSADDGKTWQVLGTGFPPVQVTSFALDSSVSPFVLRAATFGRSVLELRGSCPLCPPAPSCPKMTGCSGPVTWNYQLTCTGMDVGIIYNGGCHMVSGEPENCYAGFNGRSSASAQWSGGVGPPTWYEPGDQGSPTVCSRNNTGQQNCKIFTFNNLPQCAIPTGPNPPPGCPQGERMCTKFTPPRCVPDNQCLLQKNSPQ
jgi:photosystem II stability/assembly factor-like uncharacterized protein